MYGGARDDVPVPHYQFSDPELWKDFAWKERFAGSTEMREYFEYVADKWDPRKDSEFNTFISRADYDDKSDMWHISSSEGKMYHARFFLVTRLYKQIEAHISPPTGTPPSVSVGLLSFALIGSK